MPRHIGTGIGWGIAATISMLTFHLRMLGSGMPHPLLIVLAIGFHLAYGGFWGGALWAKMGYLRDLAKRGCLEVAGYGDRHPRDKLDLDSPKNRRVEIVLEFREPMGSNATASAESNPCEASQ
jgi:hypothetical protein